MNTQSLLIVAGLAGYASISPCTGAQTQPAQNATATSQKPSQAEINWALALEQKVKQGHIPTNNEKKRYDEISQRLAKAQKQSGR